MLPKRFSSAFCWIFAPHLHLVSSPLLGTNLCDSKMFSKSVRRCLRMTRHTKCQVCYVKCSFHNSIVSFLVVQIREILHHTICVFGKNSTNLAFNCISIPSLHMKCYLVYKVIWPRVLLIFLFFELAYNIKEPPLKTSWGFSVVSHKAVQRQLPQMSLE